VSETLLKKRIPSLIRDVLFLEVSTFFEALGPESAFGPGRKFEV